MSDAHPRSGPFAFLKEVKQGYDRDHAHRLAVALAFYGSLSLAPLVVLAVLIVGIIFGHGEAGEKILRQTEAAIGTQGAEIVEDILQSASQFSYGILPLLVGAAALLIGASRLFLEMQRGLNRIWGVPLARAGIRRTIVKRVLSCAMVVGLGLFLGTVTIAAVVLEGAASVLEERIPGGLPLARTLALAVPFAATALVLALIFRYVPDAATRWRTAWAGAGATALVLLLMRFLVGLYVTRSTLASAYGAAGSFVVLLLWLYYSSIVFYLGAEFTAALRRRGLPPEKRRRGPASG